MEEEIKEYQPYCPDAICRSVDTNLLFILESSKDSIVKFKCNICGRVGSIFLTGTNKQEKQKEKKIVEYTA